MPKVLCCVFGRFELLSSINNYSMDQQSGSNTIHYHKSAQKSFSLRLISSLTQCQTSFDLHMYVYMYVNSWMIWFTCSFEKPIMLPNSLNFMLLLATTISRIFVLFFWNYWLLWGRPAACIICAVTVKRKFRNQYLFIEYVRAD